MTPDELADSIRDIHGVEYDTLHPEVGAILDALCGPIDPLTGQRQEARGINGKIDALTSDMRENNGKVTFSRAAKWFGASTIAGLFSILYLLLQHVLTAG